MTSSYRVQLVYLGDTAPSAEEAQRLATQFEAPLRVMLARYDHHSARADKWRRDPLSLNPQGRIAVDLDAATVDTLETGQHAKKGRLSATGRPKKAEQLALVDIERQIVDR